jgi:polyisoprenoid-binding protein YceI
MKQRSSFVLLLGAALLFAGLVLPTVAGAASYSVDPTHSSAIFKIKHLGTSNFYGAFKGMSGTVDFDPANPAKSSVNVTIQSASVDSRNEQRDGHIKSPDFLNAAEFPTITFESTGVKSLGGDRYEVAGNLTLLGVTKPVTAMVEKTGEGTNPRNKQNLIGFEATFTVDRTAHDMSFMSGPLGNEIAFILAIEAIEQ